MDFSKYAILIPDFIFRNTSQWKDKDFAAQNAKKSLKDLGITRPILIGIKMFAKELLLLQIRENKGLC